MSSTEISIIRDFSESGARLRTAFFEAHLEDVARAARAVADRLSRGGKVLFCGNGGSAADCQHLAAEFVSKFQMDRPPLPAVALTTDTSVLTAVGNDFGFEEIFARQIGALAGQKDVVVGISTSGSSPNVLRALEAAAHAGAYRIGLTGSWGGDMVKNSDIVFQVPSDVTALIQEIHIALGHMLCRLADHYLFEAKDAE